jgi:hypothetical protein
VEAQLNTAQFQQSSLQFCHLIKSVSKVRVGFERLVCPENISARMIAETNCIIRLAICWLLALGSLSSIFALLPDDDFNANTATAASALQKWYNPKGLWDTTDWWNAANCMEALESAVAANNGQNYLNVISNTFKLNAKKDFLNDYYDDEGWALVWIHAYDLTGKTFWHYTLDAPRLTQRSLVVRPQTVN